MDGDARHIQYLPLDDIIGAARNPKRHHADGLIASIGRFGFATPALRDERTGRLVVGHGRTEALRAMRDAGEDAPSGVRVDDAGRWLVPVVCGWASRSDAEAEAYLVADNRHTELGGWDNQELADLLADVQAFDPELVDIAGWDLADLDELLSEAEPAVTELPPALSDPGPSAPPADPVTKPGDIWILGRHRIICGDCRDYDTVATLLGGVRVNVAFTSPPYADRRVYDESSGFRPIPPDEYVDWFEDVQANVRAFIADDGSWFVNIKASADGLDTELYVLDMVIAHVRQWGWHFATEFCWERVGMPKSVTQRFKNQFEPIYQFALGRWKMRPDAVRIESDSVPIPRGPGVGETNWANRQGGNGEMLGESAPGLAYPGNRLPTFMSTHEAVGHTAAFPVGLPAWFIRAYSDPGDVIFDPFMGSGSTLIAAHQEGRVAYGSEISPAYTDVICRRYQEHTGEVPVLASTGQHHDFTA